MRARDHLLAARENVTKLGHVLACDWLVSGSFVQSSGRTHVWTKIIDIRDGVVLDLNDSPLDGADFSCANRTAVTAITLKSAANRVFMLFTFIEPWN